MSYSENIDNPDIMNDPHLDSELETIECIVKWFNPIKGYGFVVPKMGAEDIFIHFSVVDAAGYQHLGTGTEMVCRVADQGDGRQVKEIVEIRKQVDDNEHYSTYVVSNRSLKECEGEVKWFNAIRGFGFVMPDNGDREVFVHYSVLKRHGLTKINPGERVRMQVVTTDHGPQAWSISVL